MKKLLESQQFWYALLIFLQTVVGVLTAKDVGVLPIGGEASVPDPCLQERDYK